MENKKMGDIEIDDAVLEKLCLDLSSRSGNARLFAVVGVIVIIIIVAAILNLFLVASVSFGMVGSPREIRLKSFGISVSIQMADKKDSTIGAGLVDSNTKEAQDVKKSNS